MFVLNQNDFIKDLCSFDHKLTPIHDKG